MDDEAPEILVLSPELLQKLGINLQQITSTCNDENSKAGNGKETIEKQNKNRKTRKKTSKKPNNKDENTESSILKVASLMKESVLLSPTFSAMNNDNSINVKGLQDATDSDQEYLEVFMIDSDDQISNKAGSNYDSQASFCENHQDTQASFCGNHQDTLASSRENPQDTLANSHEYHQDTQATFCKNHQDTQASFCENHPDTLASFSENHQDTQASFCENHQDTETSSCENHQDTLTSSCENNQGTLASSCENHQDTQASIYENHQDTLASSCENHQDTLASSCENHQDTLVSSCENHQNSLNDSQNNISQLNSDNDACINNEISLKSSYDNSEPANILCNEPMIVNFQIEITNNSECLANYKKMESTNNKCNSTEDEKRPSEFIKETSISDKNSKINNHEPILYIDATADKNNSKKSDDLERHEKSSSPKNKYNRTQDGKPQSYEIMNKKSLTATFGTINGNEYLNQPSIKNISIDEIEEKNNIKNTEVSDTTNTNGFDDHKKLKSPTKVYNVSRKSKPYTEFKNENMTTNNLCTINNNEHIDQPNINELSMDGIMKKSIMNNTEELDTNNMDGLGVSNQSTINKISIDGLVENNTMNTEISDINNIGLLTNPKSPYNKYNQIRDDSQVTHDLHETQCDNIQKNFICNNNCVDSLENIKKKLDFPNDLSNKLVEKTDYSTNINDPTILQVVDVNKEFNEVNANKITSSKSEVNCFLNIEGIEKPGGIECKTEMDCENYDIKLNRASIFKKYKNNKGYKKSNLLPEITKNVYDNTENEINIYFPINKPPTEDFCICTDFGSFDDEIDSNYEHVHLQNHTPIDCKVEDLFDNDNIIKQKTILEIDEEITGNVYYNNLNVCWTTVIKNLEDDVEENIPDQTKKRGHKRNRVSIDSSSSDDTPLAKLSKTKNNSIISNIDNNSVQATVHAESENITKCLSMENLSQDSVNDISYHAENCEDFEISDESVVCGVCDIRVPEEKWIEHIRDNHKYLAWKKGDAEIDMEDSLEVIKHLQLLSKKIGGLKCSKCDITKKYAKSYLTHYRICNNEIQESINNNTIQPEENEPIEVASKDSVNIEVEIEQVAKCGVCNEIVDYKDWIDHIQNKHDYLAWKEGEEPLDLEDKELVNNHLYEICKKIGGLKCSKCGLVRKYIKPYLNHVSVCEGPVEEVVVEEPLESDIYDKDGDATCGVCETKVAYRDWIEHIQQNHNYVAWIKEDETLDLGNQERIIEHLTKLQETSVYVFICKNCGFRRKKPIAFYKHTKVCFIQNVTQREDFEETVTDDSIVKFETPAKDEKVTCAVCDLTVKYKDWATHSREKHYNLAWIKGTVPIDLRNPIEVEKHLRVYKQKYKKFICKICKLNRVSCIGFFAHYLVCGKTEEEADVYKETCDKCQTKYLSIYRQQHMRYHEVQDVELQNKLQRAEEKKKIQYELPKPREENYTQGREAAMKARAVFKTLDENFESISKNKQRSTNIKSLDDSKNDSVISDDDYDSAESVHYSSEDSTDSDTDGRDIDEDDYSDNDNQRKRNNEIIGNFHKHVMPFEVKNIQRFLSESLEEFCKENYSRNSDLYTEWQHSEIEYLDEEKRQPYLPQLSQSCHIRINGKKIGYLETFQGNFSDKISTVYLGGWPHTLAWAPPQDILHETNHPEYLAVGVKKNYDTINYDQLSVEQNCIQLLNFGDFKSPPTVSICMAHNWGTVNALRWCPSGTRSDLCVGLLAAACSDGLVHIFPVPVSSESTTQYCKIKPVVELKLCMTEERRKYQATSLDWSMKKGHSVILVGYSDGVIAHYDLAIDSPMLRSTQDGIVVIYPYHEEKPLKSSVLGLTNYWYASALGSESYTATSWAGMAIRTRSGPAALLQLGDYSTFSGVCPTPHWPSATFCADETNVVQRPNEVSAWGESRRVAVSRRVASCAHCGGLATLTPPLLAATTPPHPAARGARRLRMAIEMVPLKKDQKKLDVEPTRYEDTIKTYGLKIYEITSNSKIPRIEVPPIDRFSLSEPIAMEFCPSVSYHDRLAILTLSGLLIVLPFSYDA